MGHNMDQQCRDCGQKDNCQKVYTEIGKFNGPSVLLKAVQAFVLPLIILISVLAAAEKIIGDKLKSEAVKNIAAFAAAILFVFLYLAVLKFWRRKN